MKIISHRGNLYRGTEAIENKPSAIHDVLRSTSFDVEVDIWRIKNKIYLGHDKPEYFLCKHDQINDLLFGGETNVEDRIWYHAKNLNAFFTLKTYGFNTFMHDTDPLTVTTNGTVWCSPHIIPPSNVKSVVVLPEQSTLNIIEHDVWGICTDYPNEYV